MRRKYSAFGLRKTLSEWSKDPRCPIGRGGLKYRVNILKMTIREAFARSAKGRNKHFYEGFGERKTLGEWRRDPRCPMATWQGLFYRVVKHGMTIEEAFAVGLHDFKRVHPKTLQKLQTPITAWGETKTAAEWAVDPRANVPARLIVDRIRRGRTSPEDSISLSVRELQSLRTKASHGKHYHTAFGERKTLGEWFHDPRCQLSRWGFYFRVLRMGLTVEEALLRGPYDPSRKRRKYVYTKKPGPKPKVHFITAWGETKSIDEWAADPRAKAKAALILARLRQGYPPDLAISSRKWQARPKNAGAGDSRASGMQSSPSSGGKLVRKRTTRRKVRH